MRRIFDGHLDLSWNALSWDRDITLALDALNQSEQGMTDHPGRGAPPPRSRRCVAEPWRPVRRLCRPDLSLGHVGQMAQAG